MTKTEDEELAELYLDCIDALCQLSIRAAKLARTAYDGAVMLTEKLMEPE